MTLAHFNDRFSIEPHGIRFAMLDGKHSQTVVVHRQGLTDSIGGNPSEDERRKWFSAHRSEVEKIAASKYAARAFEADGTILITPSDLNPHLYA